MADNVFGSLSTTDRRVAYLQAQGRGIRHLARLTPRTPGPEDTPELLVTVAQSEPLAAITCHIHEPAPRTVPLTRSADMGWQMLNWAYEARWTATLPAYPHGTLVRYSLTATAARDGRALPVDDGAIYAYIVDTPAAPAWAETAIVYQIFPDRFSPGRGRDWRPVTTLDDIHGGTLRGIVDHLDYIAEMGFNCLWLNPFFPDTSHHGYHATDYFAINPRLGSADDLRALVDGAHARGIRLLLDFVANHWGSDHPTFQAAAADRDSEYHDWYRWRAWPDDYDTFFGVKALPQLNVDNPAVRAHLLEAATYWLTEWDFDGLRLDYAIGPSLDFWTALRQAVKRARPDAWMFGEVVEPSPSQLRYHGRLDGCLDFMVNQALRQTFAYGNQTLPALDAFLHEHERFFPAGWSRPSFLDNHDMDRFLFAAGNDTRRLKLAALVQFTLPGPPIVYNGTEVGVTQGRFMHDDGSWGMSECRRPMAWGADQDADLRDYFRALIHFRRDNPILTRGARRTLAVDDAFYAYTVGDGSDTVTVALNASDRPVTRALGRHTLNLPPLTGRYWSGAIKET